jgi:polyketide biosynthesis enoyl-CoA hydratase PksH
MSYETIQVTIRNGVCTIRIDRPQANNAINTRLVEEFTAALAECDSATLTPPVSILVIEGSPTVFCSGGDFESIAAASEPADPAPLYDLWLRLTAGPYITVSVVRGRVNAGGLGFVAASDIVLADRTAAFSLSELLFGLFPACVLPFLIRRVGGQKAHYLTLMTRSFGAEDALAWGLVDALDDDVESLLRKHLLRLGRLAPPAIARYKRYRAELDASLKTSRGIALAANCQLFSQPEIQRNIRRYISESKFPWE